MDAGTTLIILFGMLFAFLLFNVPLVVAIGLPTIVCMLLSGFNIAIPAQRMFASVDSFTILAIPFFMFAGKIMEVGGMSKRIVRFANCLIGWMHGGLAQVIVVASAFFGALSGSGVATTAAIGSTLMPEMKKKGYPMSFVAGLQAVAGGLGLIIPPSIPMIMYGVCTGTSVGKLFMAGVLPGIVMAACLMTMVGFQAKRQKIRQSNVFTWKEFGLSFLDAFPALLVPLIILGGIYGGFFSPTEAGAVAAIYGLLVGIFYYREINRKNIGKMIGDSIVNSALVLMLISVSGAFSWLLTTNGVAKVMGQAGSSLATTKIAFLIIVNILLLIIGCFIETCAAVLIISPILYPVAVSLQVDPIHFGIITVVNLAIGLCTPPVGENQYVAAQIAKHDLSTQIKGSLPFLCASLLGLAIITMFPQLSTWLPSVVSK